MIYTLKTVCRNVQYDRAHNPLLHRHQSFALPESKDTLYARYQIILRQRKQAYKRIEEAKATAAYMDKKVQHYEQILSGLIPDDSNPEHWTEDTRPEKH